MLVRFLLHAHSSLALCLARLTASSRVTGPPQPTIVRVGDSIELTCHLSPQTDARGLEVRWLRSRHYPAVHVYENGAHAAGEQMAEYRGRTAVVTDAAHEGKLTLQIHDARTSDDGQYRCLFGKDGVYQEARVPVQVTGKGSRSIFWLLQPPNAVACGSGETSLTPKHSPRSFIFKFILNFQCSNRCRFLKTRTSGALI